MGSKSTDAAGIAIALADRFKIRVLCARQFQNKISESVFTLLKAQIERFGLQDRFEVQKTTIVNRITGAEFLFYGLWRDIDEVKSMEGVDLLWLEEAHALTEDQWMYLEPTVLRNAFAQVWIIFNPRLATDFAYKRFVINPPANSIIRKINYDENPFLSQSALDLIRRTEAEDEDLYNHVYLGIPRDSDDNAVIKREWIMSSIDAHLALQMPPAGAKRIGFDIADSGADKCAEVYAHGHVVSWSHEWKAEEDELLKSCTKTWNDAILRGATVVYDCIGVGASAGAKFAELNQASGGAKRIEYAKFNAGGAVHQPDRAYSEGVTNADMFLNIKAQAWWMVADRFRNTFNAVKNGKKYRADEIISVSSSTPNLERLIDELSTPKRDYDANGRVKVESKKDLAKRDVSSPNIADAFIMAFAPTKASSAMTVDYLNALKLAVRK